jgi:hypothetical protein
LRSDGGNDGSGVDPNEAYVLLWLESCALISQALVNADIFIEEYKGQPFLGNFFKLLFLFLVPKLVPLVVLFPVAQMLVYDEEDLRNVLVDIVMSIRAGLSFTSR